MEIIRKRDRVLLRTSHGTAELDYRLKENVMIIFHTFVPEEDRGGGIAEKLAFDAFEFAVANNLKVKPDCPYIKHFLEVHKDMIKYSVK